MTYNNLAELFKATADAIRSKTGSTAPIVANDFPAAIAGISGGGSGGSDANAVCVVYDSSKEYEVANTGTMAGNLLKLSDAIVTVDEYPEAIMVSDFGVWGVELTAPEDYPEEMLAMLMCATPPFPLDSAGEGVATFNNMILCVSKLSDTSQQLNIPSTGIWLIEDIASRSSRYSFMFIKK